MKNLKFAFLLIGAFVLRGIPTVSAADVTFQTPTFESANSDVSLMGTLQYAYNFTSDANANATVNGVTFAALANGANNDVFTNYANSYNGFNSSKPPYSNLSAGYQTLLGSAYYQGNTGQLTLKNLTAGSTYLFEYFVDDSRALGGIRSQTLAGGSNSVVLELNGSDGAGNDGSLGQYVIGTFTADATTQDFFITGTPQSNGFQLRDITVVPEARSNYALLGVAVCGVWMARRRLWA